ncbi:hypothetical protein EW026_g8351 [Hermanssonia centrifuga]|uniref:DEK-C domain-containing protein n=1 Tax=Hermanssonia centrifuga TaxID=98765 RepID=A0A4S4K4I0_9APHY|nr:hypothetical protein EW026_g8351 [Hermanssonia centrifuga]
MADNNISAEEIPGIVKDVVLQAHKSQSLDQLTPRLIRQQVEDRMGLELGALDEKQYKTVVKQALDSVMAELGDPSEAEQPAPVKPKKAAQPKKPTKRKSSEAAEGEEKLTKKTKAAPAKKKAETNTRGKKGKVSVIPSSDEEDEPSKDSTTKPKTKSEVEHTSSPPKKRQKKDAMAIDEEGEVSNGVEKPRPSTPADLPDTNGATGYLETDDVAMDSSTKATKGKRKSKAAVEELSPDDQEIKRLKSFVVGCGVRKVWAREFKDVDKREQIRRLRHILADLGMTGRLSMEKAKQIKEKRELAKELEDVQQFEKAVVDGPAPSRRSKARSKAEEASESEEESEVELPKKKRLHA